MGRLGRTVDWRKKFTPEEATKAIFGSDSYEVVEAYDAETGNPFDCCKFHGVALQFLNCLLREIVRDEANFCLILGGESLPNPLNTLDNYQARFSLDAYYSWWVANPHGVPCPAWFKDFAEDDEIRVGQMPPPFEELERRRERRKIAREATWTYRLDRDRLREQNERLREQLRQLRQLRHRAKKGTPQAEAPDDQAIIEGLTVEDVRAMCAHSAPLKSILIATANWHKIPNGYQQKRDDTTLETLLNQQAKIDRWGTANDNGVAKEDLPILKRYITGNVKGRGKK